MIKYYIDADGNYLGAWESGHSDIPNGATEIAAPPPHNGMVWDGNTWTVGSDALRYAIYDYLPNNLKYNHRALPSDIDFVKAPMVRFQRKDTFSYGELTEIVYYLNQTPNPDGVTFTYDTPIVRETFEYTRDSEGFPISRVQTIEWYFEDGTVDTENVKTRHKIYADKSVDTLNELIRRRDNNIKNIIGALIPLIMQVRPEMSRQDIIKDGQEFFGAHNTERNLYIYEGTTDLEEVVRDSSMFSWLASDISTFTPYTTIRGFIINQLSNGQRNI